MRKNSTSSEKFSKEPSCSQNEQHGGPYKISRRSFLGSSALVVLPTLCAGCTDDVPPPIDLPAVANNTIAIPLADFPQLTKASGSIVGQSKGYANPIVIAHVSDTTYAALDAICTHMRCTVAYNPLGLSFDCPCHGSSYEVDGRLINGPALRPLKAFTATSDGTTLTITLA